MQRRASAATYMYTKRKKRLAGGFNELHEKKISVAFFMVCKREAKIIIVLGGCC